ncbi:MAG: hypothetical protein AB4352_02030 [Hormoscilla sp.]
MRPVETATSAKKAEGKMKLDLQQRKLGTQSRYNWSSESNRSQTELAPNQWVQFCL